MPNLIVDENKLLIENQKDSPESETDSIVSSKFFYENDRDTYWMAHMGLPSLEIFVPPKNLAPKDGIRKIEYQNVQ